MKAGIKGIAELKLHCF